MSGSSICESSETAEGEKTVESIAPTTGVGRTGIVLCMGVLNITSSSLSS
jgi:hypothetical protein